MSNISISKVYLLHTPLNASSEHTLWFETKEKQMKYFLSKQFVTSESFNYVRKDGYIKFNDHIDKIMSCNYLMYQNTLYKNKWFYCFITDMKYINDETTAIYFKVDVLQTFMFDYSFQNCFIEREHVDNDTFGLHTLDEQLETGEYTCNEEIVDTTLKTTAIVMGSSVDPTTLKAKIGTIYAGIYSGIRYYTYTASKMTEMLQALTDDTKAEAVQSLFIAPTFLTRASDSGQIVGDGAQPESYFNDIQMNTMLDGYKPRNNKLLTSKYNYLLVLNMNGGSAKYDYELFSNPEDMKFKVQGVLCPGCSIRMFPTNYKGLPENPSEHINLGKYPQCNWATDQYTNWLTQNGVNVATNIIGGVWGGVTNIMGGFVNAAMGNVVGTAMTGSLASTGFGGVANALNQLHLAQLMPPQTSGNTNCGDVVASAKDNTFHFYYMSVRREYAQIIDQFFDMYGYKVNEVKSPNTNHRENYWFTKTIGCNLTGSFPQTYLNELQQIYDRGVTFWRSPSNIYNYSVSNKIVE